MSKPDVKEPHDSSLRPYLVPFEYAETDGDKILCPCGRGLEISWSSELCLSCGKVWGLMPSGKWARLEPIETVVRIQDGDISEESVAKLRAFFKPAR